MNRMDDDEIRRLIGGIDPARSLAPATDDDITRLANTIMSTTETTTGSTTPAPIASLDRRRRGWVIGGIAALAAAAAAVVIVPLALESAGGTTTLAQAPGGGPTAMCAAITPESLAQSGLAFRATVTSVEGGTATLHVVDRFAGEVSDTVEVPQGPGTGVDGEAIAFEQGVTYLVAADGGVISSCGATGVDSPELDALFQQAF